MNYIYKLCALSSIMLLAACQPSPDTSTPDQCIRAELFQQCMKALPSGPQFTRYNDWDEVVNSCERAAYSQSLRTRKMIKSECQP